jgi:hypothetical protein
LIGEGQHAPDVHRCARTRTFITSSPISPARHRAC